MPFLKNKSWIDFRLIEKYPSTAKYIDNPVTIVIFSHCGKR